VAAVPGAVGPDLGEGGAEHRLAPAERAGGDRLVAEPGVRPVAEPLEVVAEVVLLRWRPEGNERTQRRLAYE
jgi:hypothetical protein